MKPFHGRVSPTWRAKKIDRVYGELIQKGPLVDYAEAREVVNSCNCFFMGPKFLSKQAGLVKL